MDTSDQFSRRNFFFFEIKYVTLGRFCFENLRVVCKITQKSTVLNDWLHAICIARAIARILSGLKTLKQLFVRGSDSVDQYNFQTRTILKTRRSNPWSNPTCNPSCNPNTTSNSSVSTNAVILHNTTQTHVVYAE